MTYEQLEKVLEKIENIDDILKQFKVNVENNIVLLEQDCEINERDYGNIYSEMPEEDSEEFYFKWKYVSSDCIFNLYNKMGWSASEFQKRTIGYPVDANCAYVNYYFSDAWFEISKLDDRKFFYAMISLIESMSNDESHKVYTYIKYPIIKFLKEYNLYFILEEEESRTVFIAMSFDDKMSNARKTIMKVIEKAGYNPIIMDMKEHNNQIVPEIFYEIKKSRFVVADLTQHKTGVYYEIGYADALEKEIIVSCNSKDAKKTHFDVAQKNIIKWIDEDDLDTRLQNRIKATIGDFHS